MPTSSALSLIQDLTGQGHKHRRREAHHGPRRGEPVTPGRGTEAAPPEEGRSGDRDSGDRGAAGRRGATWQARILVRRDILRFPEFPPVAGRRTRGVPADRIRWRRAPQSRVAHPRSRLCQAGIRAASTLDELAGVVAAHPDSMDGVGGPGAVVRSGARPRRRTRSPPMPVSGSATTVDWMRCAATAGTAASRSGGRTRPIGDSCGVFSGLARMADRLGELSEAERCARFLIDLDPDWNPSTGMAEPAG